MRQCKEVRNKKRLESKSDRNEWGKMESFLLLNFHDGMSISVADKLYIVPSLPKFINDWCNEQKEKMEMMKFCM